MLTLVVVACNEADRIGRCLDSVPASRKLVLDSGSTDVTVSVARAHGAEVIETDWPGFVAQKNRALALVDTPFALSLDADEWLSHAAAAEVAAVLADPGTALATDDAMRITSLVAFAARNGPFHLAEVSVAG